jgi:hypothetical protein
LLFEILQTYLKTAYKAMALQAGWGEKMLMITYEKYMVCVTKQENLK